MVEEVGEAVQQGGQVAGADGQDDDVAGGGEGGGRGGGLGADFGGEGLRAPGRDVKDAQRGAGRSGREAAQHGAAHVARAEESDGHLRGREG